MIARNTLLFMERILLVLCQTTEHVATMPPYHISSVPDAHPSPERQHPMKYSSALDDHVFFLALLFTARGRILGSGPRLFSGGRQQLGTGRLRHRASTGVLGRVGDRQRQKGPKGGRRERGRSLRLPEVRDHDRETL